MKNIVYLSTARRGMRDEELTDILRSSRRNNFEFGITGVLLYCQGTFIQVLEGHDDGVDEVFFDLILHDDRHKNVIILIDESISERSFGDFEMGYAALELPVSATLIEDLTTTNRILSNNSTSPAVRILKSFIHDNNLVISN